MILTPNDFIIHIEYNILYGFFQCCTIITPNLSKYTINILKLIKQIFKIDIRNEYFYPDNAEHWFSLSSSYKHCLFDKQICLDKI